MDAAFVQFWVGAAEPNLIISGAALVSGLCFWCRCASRALPAAIFGVGAVYGLLSSAVVLTLPSVRRVTWAGSEPDKP